MVIRPVSLIRSLHRLRKLPTAIVLLFISTLLLVTSVSANDTISRCSQEHPEFPGVLEIARSSAVQNGMKADWAAGLKDQRERGRWILWNKDTGNFSLALVKVGNDAKGADELNQGFPPPDQPPTYAVGMYHTHPLNPDPKYSQIGPSSTDRTNATLLRVPSLIVDRDPSTKNLNDYDVYAVGAVQSCEPPQPDKDGLDRMIERSTKIPKAILGPSSSSGTAGNNGGSNGSGTAPDSGTPNGGAAGGTPVSGGKGTGSSFGDPHMLTLDGFRYSFQTVGEFLLAQSQDGQLIVQTRQTAVPNRDLSLNTAVAVKIGRDRVGYYAPTNGKDVVLKVNGEAITLQDETVKLSGGGFLQKRGSEYTIESDRSEQVVIRPIQVANLKFVNVTLSIPETQRNQMVGLLGNFDSNPNNDLKTRLGKVLPSQSSYGSVKSVLANFLPVPMPLDAVEREFFAKLNRDFGDSWRIKPEESLFDYSKGESTATFSDRRFPKRYHSLVSLMPSQLRQAEAVCREAGIGGDMLQGCLMDVGLTGDASFARSMVNTLARNVLDRATNRALDEVRSRVKIPIRIRIPGF